MSVTDTGGGRVLVLDGDAMNRRVLSSTLAADGLKVSVATDKRAGLRLLSVEPFEVVLLDLLLPPSGGLAVLEQLRDKHADVGVIMVAAPEHSDRLVTCLELGVHDYLHKPVNPVLLRTRVRSCLAFRRLRALEMAERELPDREG